MKFKGLIVLASLTLLSILAILSCELESEDECITCAGQQVCKDEFEKDRNTALELCEKLGSDCSSAQTWSDYKTACNSVN